MLEPPPDRDPAYKGFARSLSLTSFTNALIAFVFATSAPVAIMLATGAKAGLSNSDLASWLFAAFAINGVFSIAISILYRMPLAFFWTIPGTVLVGDALTHVSLSDAVGAYLVAGILLLILGLTGWIRFLLDRIPMPIIMAMVAAVFLKFGLGWVTAFKTGPFIAIAMTATFALVTAIEQLQRLIRPMIAVLLAGCLAMIVSDQAPSLAALALQDAIVRPVFTLPTLSVQAIAELSVPLVITVVAANNAQGIAILKSKDYRPPTNVITLVCGIASLAVAMFGCVSTCLTGPSTAIMASGPERSQYFGAGIYLGLLSILFGVFAPFFTNLMLATPSAFVASLAGLALLKVLQDAFRISFQNGFTLGAVITFLVTLADQPILGIGAAFWGLVFGMLTSWLAERPDFRPRKPA